MLRVRNACAWYEMKAQHETKPVSQGMKLLYKGMKKVKFFLGSEKLISQGMKLLNKGMKKVKSFLGSEKVISQGMKLLYKGMKKIKFFLWSEKVVSQGMKLLYKGMKKFKFFLWSEKVPVVYEKKPVFENFPFHTLGYENFGCFFLMTPVVVGQLPRIRYGKASDLFGGWFGVITLQRCIAVLKLRGNIKRIEGLSAEEESLHFRTLECLLPQH